MEWGGGGGGEGTKGSDLDGGHRKGGGAKGLLSNGKEYHTHDEVFYIFYFLFFFFFLFLFVCLFCLASQSIFFSARAGLGRERYLFFFTFFFAFLFFFIFPLPSFVVAEDK